MKQANPRYQVMPGLLVFMGLLAACVSLTKVKPGSTSQPTGASSAVSGAYLATVTSPTASESPYPGPLASPTSTTTPAGTPYPGPAKTATQTPPGSAPAPTATFSGSATPVPTPTPLPTWAPNVTLPPTVIPTQMILPMPAIGVETTDRLTPKLLSRMAEANVTWMRRNAYLWSEVEPVEGERNWEAMSDLESQIQEASAQGIHVILQVRSTPPWAQKVPGYFCGPILLGRMDAFANFMRDLVARLSVPPYNVKYWELGNEPDVAPSQVSPDNIFGCWGDPNDEFFGGSYYAKMLKAVYPAIKEADPDAKVLIGGLLLDCDPRNPPSGKTANDCKSSWFLKGILEGGGASYFDIVSYHGYPFYWDSLQADIHHPIWEKSGGVTLGKAAFIREVLNSYDIDKPVMLTEVSLICPEWNPTHCNPPGEDFYQAQADYVVEMFTRTWAYGLKGAIWYQLEGPGWRYGSLLDNNQEPKPDFQSFQFFNKEMQEAEYIQLVKNYPPLAGYEFRKPDKLVWILWSYDEKTYSISLPAKVLNVYDEFGNDIIPAGSEISVNHPIYVEIEP